jgi:acyl-CoA reductase-like NAD-dependent aldehyde dehydrogenase
MSIKIVSTNPAMTDNVLGEVSSTSLDEIKKIVLNARQAQEDWYNLGLDKRVQHMRDLLVHLTQYKDEFIKRTSLEMGIPIGLSTGIVDGGLSDLLWNCDNAHRYLSNKIVFEDDSEVNEIIHEPYGVIGCIVAWNFPFGNFIASASQALLAGNSVVMKYSEEVPLFSKYLEEVISASNLPKNVMNFVYGDGRVGGYLSDQDIDFISFTGSTMTGQKIYEKSASKLIPVALELGGSSPGIVFKDCPVTDELIEALFWERFLNSAQFCNGMKRLFVHQSLFDEVVKKLSDFAKTKIIGDPLDKKTELGPLVAERQVTKVAEQVKDALDKGAEIHCGGKKPAHLNGAYYEPTILTKITKDMRVWTEEVFGPALPIIPFDTYEEAISLANDTEYGLSAIIFTKDKNIAKKAISDLKAGTINQWPSNTYRPQNPFGGYKKSGIGRQSGEEGFLHVTQSKITSWVK